MDNFVWDLQAIEQEIPELKAMDVRNVKLKQFSEILAATIHSFGRQLKKEVKIVDSNRSHILTLDKPELINIDPAILVDCLGVMCRSLLEAVKCHRPSYQRLVQLSADREITQKKLAEIENRMTMDASESTVRVKELESIVEQHIREKKEKDVRIRALEADIQTMKMKQMKLEREVDISRAELTMKSFTLDNKQISMKDMYEMKKALDEDYGTMNQISSKNKQISSLKIMNKKKDQQLIKGI